MSTVESQQVKIKEGFMKHFLGSVTLKSDGGQSSLWNIQNSGSSSKYFEVPKVKQWAAEAQ